MCIPICKHMNYSIYINSLSSVFTLKFQQEEVHFKYLDAELI